MSTTERYLLRVCSAQGTKHELPLDLIVQKSVYSLKLCAPSPLEYHTLSSFHPVISPKMAEQAHRGQSSVHKYFFKPIQITHIILRWDLPNKVITDNREILHYLFSDLGYLIEEKEHEDATDYAEGGCGHATVGGKVSDGGKEVGGGANILEVGIRDSIEGLCRRVLSYPSFCVLVGRASRASGCGKEGMVSVQFHRSSRPNAVEVELCSVATCPPVGLATSYAKYTVPGLSP